ncbi:MAG: globin domain-containing protein [Pseudomonadota bacterium]
MDSLRIERVRDSFVHVLFDPDRASRLFYDRLFELAPATRDLFTHDIAVQGRVLIESIATIVTGLARFDAMRPTLAALAIRHAGYGVTPDHYPIVGQALLDMMERVCGDFDMDTRKAWADAYTLISDAMIAAAYPGITPSAVPATRD